MFFGFCEYTIKIPENALFEANLHKFSGYAFLYARICSGVPIATIRPPSEPPPGPISMM